MAIRFTADGQDYNLCVTAHTIKYMENKLKVDFSALGHKSSDIETLWRGLFIEHHNNVPDAKRMEIYNALASTQEDAEPEYDDDGELVDALSTAIAEEYVNARKQLQRKQGNVSWRRE